MVVRLERGKKVCARVAPDTLLGGPSTSPLDVGLSLRQTINAAVGLALLGCLAYCSYGYLPAESRVRAACAAIPVGATVMQLIQVARAHGLSIPSGNYGNAVQRLTDSRSFGRYGCRVHMKNGAVVLVQYDFAD